MKARPILMHGRSVRNLLAGRKTQTRRICKDQSARSYQWVEECPTYPPGSHFTGWAKDCGHDFLLPTKCPYGQPGDLIYVREAWRTREKLDQQNATEIANSCRNAGFRIGPEPACPIRYEAPGLLVRPWGDNDLDDFGPWGRYRHARFMPRWASRLTLHLTDVRVERVQEITEEDARAEGIDVQWIDVDGNRIYGHRPFVGFGYPEQAYSPSEAFRTLWNDTNGPGAWDRNDWVWVLCFDVIHENVDQVLAREAEPA